MLRIKTIGEKNTGEGFIAVCKISLTKTEENFEFD
jgi:hypothetical protein